MRIALLPSLGLLLAAAPPVPPAVAPPTVTVAEQAVPQDHGEQVVIVQAREFPVGASSGWHVHPGVEIAYVISGEMTLQTAAGTRVLKAGDSFTMPRGQAHNGGSGGNGTAKVLVTLIVDKGVPPRRSVPAP